MAEPERTKATPSQLIFPTSPNLSTIGDCISATIVLSSEKRKVEESMVNTINTHYFRKSDNTINLQRQARVDLTLTIALGTRDWTSSST